jgi:hypothetical protein
LGPDGPGAALALTLSGFSRLKGQPLKRLNNYWAFVRAHRILPAFSAGMRSVCRAAG